MALPREYRIRELYLKFLEENFSRDRATELVTILADSEAKLMIRLARISDREDGSMKQVIFYAYLFSVFDAYTSGRHRISSLKEIRRFRRHFRYETGTDVTRNRLIITEALRNCKLWERLEEEGIDTVAASIALFQTYLNSTQTTTLSRFSAGLKAFATYRVSAVLDDESYRQRARLYGHLLQTPTGKIASRIETIRLALQCMPSGDQKSSNVFLYIITKVFGLWTEAPARLLHVPVDTDLSRVLFRIGLTRKQLGNPEYSAISYAAIQTLARRLAPENPSILYGLKHIARVWCKSRSPDCEGCPMNGICSYAQTMLL